MTTMTDSRAADAQAQGGGEVRAKPLEWQEDGPGEWCDRHHGFHITQDDEEPQESRFTAAWGECDPERFSTLEEAQAWCQEALDRYIREWVATAPPSAPVGVEELDAVVWDEGLELPDGFLVAEHLPGIWEYQFDIEDEADDDSDRKVSGTSWNHPALAAIAAWSHAYDALAQQPAAVDGEDASDEH